MLFRSVDRRDPTRHTQRYVDVLALADNQQQTRPLADVQSLDIETDWDLFLSTDQETLRLITSKATGMVTSALYRSAMS